MSGTELANYDAARRFLEVRPRGNLWGSTDIHLGLSAVVKWGSATEANWRRANERE
jgi:hypothetical protein